MTSLQKDHAQQVKTVEMLTAQIQELRESAARSEQKLKGLQRTIPAERKEEFLKLLSQLPKAKIQVMCRGASTESKRFSEEIAEAFSKSGFEVERDYSGVDLTTVGEIIVVRNATNAPPCAGVLQQTFRALGVNMIGGEDPSLATNTVRFYIGAQPP
jgi:hypothetical protein